MRAAVSGLQAPLLLSTSVAVSIHSIEQLAKLLAPRYAVHDLCLVHGLHDKPRSLTVDVAAVAFGAVALTSVQGPALTLAVDPLAPLCTLALPSHGWGRYVLDGTSIDNTAGQTVAFLPASCWRLTNDQTGGTAIHFTEPQLISRIRAITQHHPERQLFGGEGLSVRLAMPFAVHAHSAPASIHYARLLTILSLVDDFYRLGLPDPDPMLCLDDIILRCIALLLLPSLLEMRPVMRLDPNPRDVQAAVHRVMDWMLANLDRSISLSDIEEHACYGRRALQMGFKEAVGCGPMQWLRRQRLQMAYQQLTNPGPDCTVTSVAHGCGYLNLASFSRDFRERFGLPASELLRQSRWAQGSSLFSD